MSNYTTTIYQLVQSEFDFGLKDYPIFDENYREILNQKIINHYMFYEIGFETAGQFKFYLNERMNLIMWKYNEMYKIRQTEFNALYNVDMIESFTHTIDTNNNSQNNSQYIEKSLQSDNTQNNSESKTNQNSNTNSNNISTLSQFPQNTTTYTDNHIQSGQKVIDNGSNVLYNNSEDITKIISESSNNATSSNDSIAKGNSKTIESYEKKTIGSSAGLPFSRALLQFKEYIEQYNIDNEIINELSDLFFNVF